MSQGVSLKDTGPSTEQKSNHPSSLSTSNHPSSSDIATKTGNEPSSNPTYDMSIFDNIELNNCEDNIESCQAINRLLSALKYYSILDLQHNKDHQNIFDNFIQEVYGSRLLDDFYHLQSRHGHQIHDILTRAQKDNTFIACDINDCDFANRHYRVDEESKDEIAKFDPMSYFWMDVMDSLHNYVFHLFDTGCRVVDSRPTDEDKVDDDEDRHDEECYDAEFARLFEVISSTRSATERFSRISTGNKYNINVEKLKDEPDDSQETFLEKIFNHLRSIDIEDSVIDKLQNYVKQERYDTESLDMDVSMHYGNILKHLMDQVCVNGIKSAFHLSRGITMLISLCVQAIIYRLYNMRIIDTPDTPDTFSVGIDFQYWPFGALHQEHYVKRRYSDFKEEILSYKHLDVKQYKDVILTKVDIYHQSAVVRSLTNVYYDEDIIEDDDFDDWYHLSDMEEGGIIAKERLIAVVLYTDYSDLSSHFTSSFRKRTNTEDVSAVIERNSEYWWMSKILKETIQFYGQDYENGIG